MRKIAKLAAVALCLMSLPSSAHHSFSMFDMQDVISFKAKVVRFKWQNPHSWIQVDVPLKSGRSERWAIEMNSPNNLVLQGWTRRTLRPGEIVTMYVHPLRTGAKGGAYAGVKLANGETLGVVD